MKPFNVKVLPQAYDDIRQIKYHKEFYGAYQISIQKLMSDIKKTVKKLENMPLTGRRLSTYIGHDSDIRLKVINKEHLIFYKVVEYGDGGDVTVIRILPSKTDWTKEIFERKKW